MFAFSHTYLLKSKHVWKKAPRCKYTNVFGFFQTCWVKVKHLPLPQVSILSCFGLHLFCSWVVFLSHSGCKTVKPSINVSWSSHSLYLMIPCLKKIFLCKKWLLWFKIITPKVFATLVSPCQCCSTDLTVERKIFLIDGPPPPSPPVWRSTAAIYLWVRHHPILSWFKKLKDIPRSWICREINCFMLLRYLFFDNNYTEWIECSSLT